MDSIREQELLKYRKIWERDEYRIVSPGDDCFDQAFECLAVKAGDTLYDFGAGTARATKKFIDRGVLAVGLDLADNANEFPEVPYKTCCLWDLPDDIKPVRFGFCCDVMEHIPVDMVGKVLNNIANKVLDRCFFKIACFPDRSGKLIGETLHLSVFDPYVWAFKLNAYFKCRIISVSGHYLTAICEKR